MSVRVWDILPGNGESAAPHAQDGSMPSLAECVLAARGVNKDEISSALRNTGSMKLYDPLLMQDMAAAAAAVREAVENGELICVYGDYDCDGIVATAIVVDYLTQVGARVCYRIPDREKEGYGLNEKAVKELFDYGVRLMITVDNGISANAEINYANSLGMRVVVTDHHQPCGSLPCAVSVVDPHRSDCTYPYSELCGAGVAFKLLCALEGENGYGLLEEYGDLLCIATVADVVELQDENRAIVCRGLELLGESQRCGIRALLRVTALEDKKLRAESISFILAPRMNAAGRIDSAETVVEMLLTERESEAQALAEQLNNYNMMRRSHEKTVIDGIAEQLAKNPAIADERIIVLDGEGWNAGVVGVVCSRMVERFGKPCLIIAHDGENAKGSGRSVEGFSLIDAIAACSAYLTRYGGHPMAAGFSLPTADIPAFHAAIETYAAAIAPEMPAQHITVDCAVHPAMLTVEQIRTLDVLEPFGCGNAAPVFAVMGARVERVLPLSEGKYAKLRLTRDGITFFAVTFSQRPEQLGLVPGDTVDVAFTVGINDYMGKTSAALTLCGVRFSGEDLETLHHADEIYTACLRGEKTGEEYLPSRDEAAVVYRYLRGRGTVPYYPELLYRRFALTDKMDYVHFRIAIDMMLELGLLCVQGGRLSVVAGAAKVELRSAGIARRLSGNV